MNANKKRIIAVICLLVFIVGVFVACKKDDDNLVSVSTDENGSLYYTDPTYEVDGIEYGGETHFVKPEETNKNGEYKKGDVTSAAYTTDRDGNVAPVVNEPSTTAPVTTTSGGSNNGGSSDNTTSTTSGSNGGSSGTSTTSGGGNDNTNSSQENESTSAEVLSTAGIDGVVDDNKLSNDGVINAW